MPLRQPPAEQPFSLIPPNWNPVSNDRVLLRLGTAKDSQSAQPYKIACVHTDSARSHLEDWCQEIMAREVLSIGTASTK